MQVRLKNPIEASVVALVTVFAVVSVTSVIWSHPHNYACGGTSELRHWSRERDERIMARDGYPKTFWSEDGSFTLGRSDVQIDHYVPLCLGGSDDDSNLRVQPYPAAYAKDADEVRLCHAVCKGEISREEAISALKAKWPR